MNAFKLVSCTQAGNSEYRHILKASSMSRLCIQRAGVPMLTRGIPWFPDEWVGKSAERIETCVWISGLCSFWCLKAHWAIMVAIFLKPRKTEIQDSCYLLQGLCQTWYGALLNPEKSLHPHLHPVWMNSHYYFTDIPSGWFWDSAVSFLRKKPLMLELVHDEKEASLYLACFPWKGLGTL